MHLEGDKSIGCRDTAEATGPLDSRPATPPQSPPRPSITLVDESGSRLRERMSELWGDRPGQAPVSSSTADAVAELVAWLSERSDAVSATASADGALSLAALFPDQVRLYVEIERGGRAQAAVTRERRCARDVPVGSVEDLTPQVIAAALADI